MPHVAKSWNKCCYLSFALKGLSEGFKVAEAGERFTCPRCGQNFVKARWRWESMTRAEAAQEILEMQAAEDERQKRERNA